MKLNAYAKGVIGMTASSLIFALLATLIRYARDIDFFRMSMFRFVVGVCILCTLALFKKIKLNFNNTKILFFRGFLGGIAVVLFYLAITKIGIAKGTVISFTYPVFATIGGMIFLKDRVKPLVWLLLFTSMAGVLLMTYVKDGQAHMLLIDIWTVLAFLGAVLGGVALVCVKALTRTDSSYSIYMSQCLMGFWLVVIPANLSPLAPTVRVVVVLLAIGICAAVGQLLMTWSFGKLSVTTGSLLGLLTPVCSVFVGILLFGEALGAFELVGVFVVLFSCGCIIWQDQAQSRAR